MPADLQRIVAKALEKNPDERYQTAKDMLVDLRSLKKRLDLDAEIDRTSSPDRPRPTVPSSELTRGPQQRRVLMIALIGMAIATVAIFGFSIWRSSRARIDVPVATLPAAPVPAEERTLTYWITVQKFRNGKPFKSFTVPGEMTTTEFRSACAALNPAIYTSSARDRLREPRQLSLSYYSRL